MNNLDKQYEKLISEAYNNYVDLAVMGILDNRNKLNYLIEPYGNCGRSTRMYLREEFINKVKSDNEFAKWWGIQIEQRELKCKQIKVTYNGQTEIGYEYQDNHRYLQGFINQFEEGGEHQELRNEDWTISQFLKWLKINNFKIIK
jgi:hypothetical protein